MPKNRAVTKCPNSWTNIITLRMGRNHKTFIPGFFARDHNNHVAANELMFAAIASPCGHIEEERRSAPKPGGPKESQPLSGTRRSRTFGPRHRLRGLLAGSGLNAAYAPGARPRSAHQSGQTRAYRSGSGQRLLRWRH